MCCYYLGFRKCDLCRCAAVDAREKTFAKGQELQRQSLRRGKRHLKFFEWS